MHEILPAIAKFLHIGSVIIGVITIFFGIISLVIFFLELADGDDWEPPLKVTILCLVVGSLSVGLHGLTSGHF